MARLHAIRKDSESSFGAFQQTWPYRGAHQNGETVPVPARSTVQPETAPQKFLMMSSTPDSTRVR
jgi:hypothetical protein